MEISNKSVVTINYTLKNGKGKVLDTSEGGNPLVFIQGIGNILPGLEKELAGKKPGEKVNAVIPPEEGYGIREEAKMQKVPLSEFDNKEAVKEGAQFKVNSKKEVALATVVKIDKEMVTLDLNHPLADETLCFDVEVMDVREATGEELAHGHVHGSGGHHH